MEEENALELLQRFRRDRRVLLDFILTGSLIKKVVLPPGAVTLDDVDLDQVSVDYVLNCAKRSTTLELLEAIRDYHDQTVFPQMSGTGPVGEFYLVTDPESSGSPPKRAPPSVPILTVPPSAVSIPPPIAELSLIVSNVLRSESFKRNQEKELTVDDIEDFDDNGASVLESFSARRTLNDASDLAVNLPSFSTGITDDDLRETAYEILLACAGAMGGLIVSPKEKKREKKSSFIRMLGRSRIGNVVSQSLSATGLVGLLETMRVQMEIPESTYIRTRQGLLNALVGKVVKRMDTLLIPLELLCCVSRTEFSDKKAFIRWQKRQLKVLEEGLVHHPAIGFGESGRKTNELRILLAKIGESEFLPSSTGELQRSECLRSLREIAIPHAERTARGEICHWADGYHFNVRLYEKLLLSVFDMSDEGKLTEEVGEILELLKSTWRVLGITETIHYTCYAWVLFCQYVITSEQRILLHAIEQLKKIPLMEHRGQQERLYLKSLRSKVEGERDMSFLQSFLTPIQRWTDKQLGDYHLHFSESPTKMEKIVAVAMITRRLLLEEPETIKHPFPVSDRDQIELYISLSTKSAISRTLQVVERLDMSHEHPLALLAEELKKLLKKDLATFMPVLSQRHSQAAVVSASLVHKLYGSRLKPFVDGAEHLSEDVISVFPAAESLEQLVMALITSVCQEENAEIMFNKLNLYQIETKSGTLVLRWLNSQLGKILSWVERAIQQEHWDPISLQQRHAGSIVEVYRIVEETADQFFALKVPMGFTELSSLFHGIDNVLQVYANSVVNDLARKEDLIPPVPILTRYRKESGIKAFVKKELFDTRMPDETTPNEITVLATTTLCVQLNTLYYAISHLNKLEDSIWDRWTSKRSQEKPIRKSIEEKSEGFSPKDTFDGSRKAINAAMDHICEYTATKIIFCDLRVPFINNLYRPTVSGYRVDVLMEPLDMELGQLCDIVVEPLRDHIVTCLLQASLDGLLRVILEGGSSRVFLPGDAKLLEEDLELLKEFFISGGDGLPRGVVENQVARVRHVIMLHGYETRELIEDLKSVIGMEMRGGKSRLGADSRTLLRILCHRGDSEASQFLKKQFRIPKSPT
ncbi:PREDICTED: uncharacterized protein LOC109352014 isoform X2 [Lupinus angustifolius]|uniref:uncharacterized protein LOC109352014 isoform X2 n=1 Tax=Lupinus angustifolius TaxID=3871 RepID=UPI00092F1958|nr:PREDICTED: uncharacterized protein LOC109352014 isoform X2 [Lupinus angustifolius]